MPINYSVTAEGSGELSFSLLTSADSALFAINENTGVLTATSAFDFESPADANQDNVYELGISVTDENGASVEASFVIEVQDVDEFQAVITFPVVDSNVGGGETSLHVRGYLTNDGEKVISPSEDIEVSVNGATAVFTDDDTGNWIAEITLQPGENILNIEVTQAEELVASEVGSVENSPIAWHRYSTVSDGVSNIYAIDIESAFVIETDISSGENQIILSLEDIAQDTNCEVFSRIFLSNNADKLAVECFRGDAANEEFILVNLQSNSVELFSIENAEPRRGYARWIENQYLLFENDSSATTQFSLFDFTDGSIKNFDAEMDESFGGYIENDITLIDGRVVYVEANKGPPDHERTLARFDLTPVIESSGTIAPVVATEYEYEFGSRDVLATNGIAWYRNSQSLIRLDLNTKSTTSLPISLPNGEEIPDDYMTLVYISNDSLIVHFPRDANLYHIDLATGDAVSINEAPGLWLASDLLLGPDNTQLLSYSYRLRHVTRIDVSSYTVLDTEDLSSNLLSSYDSYALCHYDWQNQILYRSLALGWNGSIPSDVAWVYGFDFNTNTDSVILTTNDLHDYFGYENAKYKIGDISVSGDENILWFAATAFLENGDTVEGVYSLNLQTQAMDTLFEESGPDIYGESDDAVLSDYYPSLDGVLLTEWQGGYVKLLKSNGDIQEIVPGDTPYLTTRSARFDSERNVVYFDGYYVDESYEHESHRLIDEGSVELVEVNLATSERRIVASNTVGRGLSLRSISPEYNQSQQLIYSIKNHELLVIDTYTGDRVLKQF